jgi:hypothetical protein
MNSTEVLFPLVSFTAAALLMWGLRPAAGPAETASAKPSTASSADNISISKTPTLLSPNPILPKLGLTGRPTLDEVFAVEGLDRNLRMTLYIQTASSSELAAAIARADEEETWHTPLTDQIWLRWTEVDPAAAIAANANVGQAWWAWAKTDPHAALAAAAGKKDLLVKVIRSIGDGDPAWARRLIAEHPEADQPSVWDGVLESMSELDPAGAATLAMEQKANLNAVLEDWTTRQPEAALAWINALPESTSKRGALESFVRKRCQMDPAAGLPEALKLPPGQSRDTLATDAIVALARTDPAAAQAAAAALPPGAGRQQALGSLAERLVDENPAHALKMLSEIVWSQADPATERQFEYFVQGGGGTGWTSDPWAQEPPFSAKGALEKLVDHDAASTISALAALPAERGAPLADAVWQWSAKEPEAASTWLRDQPPGEARDRGIDGLVRRLTDKEHNDFEAALTWAASATPSSRDKLLRKALNNFSSTDQPAAAAAAEKLGIQPGPMAKYMPSRPY